MYEDEVRLASATTADCDDGDVSISIVKPRARGRLQEGSTTAGKDDLIEFVARDLDTTKGDARLIVESVTKGIVSLIGRNAALHVPGLGSFRTLDTPAREGRNPRTGVSVPIAPGRRVAFRAAHQVKEVLARRRK